MHRTLAALLIALTPTLTAAEVIAAADERDVAMVFTGHRHFLH